MMITQSVYRLKQQESLRIQFYVKIQKNLIDLGENINPETFDFYSAYLNKVDLPIIILNDAQKCIYHQNISDKIIKNPQRLHRLVEKMKKHYEPIEVKLPLGAQYIYYKNSAFLDRLQWYPIILMLFITLFGLFIYWYYNMVKRSDQNYLWVGMAKETAHQIGTPISSLMGWLAFMKMEKNHSMPVEEIEKDINRLIVITDRFSKIGSKPKLSPEEIVSVSLQAFDYMSARVSKKVSFDFHSAIDSVYVALSIPLYGWVLENLIKNAVDSVRGKGNISLNIFQQEDQVFIQIKDDGQGIPKAKQKQIFKPGYTTKKRGWGLGLSLAKRIIEEYHNGKIGVHESSREKGTIFRIILPVFTEN